MINKKIISLDAEKECDKFQCSFFFFFGCLGAHSVQAFSGCKQGLLSSCHAQASPCDIFSLQSPNSRHADAQLCHTALVAALHVGSSLTRDQISVPCIGRQILNH